MLITSFATLLAAAAFNGGAQPNQVSPPSHHVIKKKAKPACRPIGSFHATVYGPPWGGIEGGPITAMGHKLSPGRHFIAVDPRVIKLGTPVKVWPNPLHYRGAFMAADTGGAIKGRHIDVFVWQGTRFMDAWGNRPTRVCALKKARRS